MKKIISAILLFTMIASLAGCSVEEGKTTNPSADPMAPVHEPAMSTEELRETVLIVDGSEVSMAEVRYQAASLMSAYEYYGDGYVDFTEEIEGKTAADFFIDEAVDTCKLFRAVERYAAENGYSFTEEELKEIDEEISEYVEQVGGKDAFNEQLELAGMTPELYEYLVKVPKLYYKIYGALYGEGGEQEITDDTVESYFLQNYYTTRHIMKIALDEYGEYLSEEDTQKVYSDTEKLLERIRGGEDFAKLAEAESEDDELSGETLTFTAVNLPEAYVETVQALKPGEVSGIIDIDGAYVIAKREELDTSYLEENFDAVKEEYGLGLFRIVLEEVRDRLSVTETAAFSKVDVEEIYDAFFGY